MGTDHSLNDSEFIHFLRFSMVCGLVFLHLFGVDGAGNDPRGGMEAYTLLVPAAVNSLIHMLFMCAVPILSGISGYLFSKSASGFSASAVTLLWKKKVVTLLFPMVLFGAFWVSLGYLGFLLSGGEWLIADDRYPFGTMAITQYADAILGYRALPLAMQFWFVHDLLITFLMAPILMLLGSNRKMIFLSLLLGTLIWFKGIVPPGMFTGNVTYFFFLGAFYHRLGGQVVHGSLLRKSTIWYWAGCIFIVLLIFRAWFYIFVSQESWMTKWIMSEYYLKGLRILGALTMYAGLFMFARSWRHSYLRLVSLSELTFWLFAMHFPLLELIKKSFAYIVGTETTWQVLPAIFVVPLFCILICLCLGSVFKRFGPKAYSICTGGR